MTDASPPPMPSYSPTPQVKKSRTNLITAASAAAVIAAVVGTGMVVVHSSYGSKLTATAKPTGSATETPTPTPSYDEVTADSFTIELRTTKRQCFGTAGCNVTVEPDLTYLGDSEGIDPDTVYEITYEIHGDESGPVIETAQLSDRTSLNYTPSMISTASAGTNVSVEITDVTAQGG
ncbi:hypothetical protein [Streptomyces olivochromogenes]|uniref:Uncharacterized protein n=1 Tax=Streptomyces olivochromogenes TaxID=1963 RepID=A0A250VGS3_STROL|nr:hypothetical protein [Streptomyces olivochromogenes]KUN45121.1 hypothetical protein AQJ27_23945 [Streptomyces olivochromogenes]GAX53284.1 hypothetical protein SO3561_04812 [Streptomyces olivochromogenes]